MSDHTDADWWERPGAEGPEPADPEGVETIEAYEVENGVVLYDAENPLAWVEATRAVRLSDYA